MSSVVSVAGIPAADALWNRAGTSGAIHGPECNSQLESLLRGSANNLCLQLIQIFVPASNVSEIVVPVLVMKPGSTTTMDILYNIGSESLGHIGPKLDVAPTDRPQWLSVPYGNLSHEVVFSDGRVIFQSATIVIYRYNVSAGVGSNGYYALLPPLYSGINPALDVNTDPVSFNLTTLATWAFTGVLKTAEFSLPSYIVGTGNLDVVNVTLPDDSNCANPACNLISNSLF